MKKILSLILFNFIFICCLYSADEHTYLIKEVKLKGFHSIAKSASIFEDKDWNVTFDSIANNPSYYENLFEPIQDDIPYLDFTRSSYWVKFEIKNDLNENNNFYLEVASPLTNKVDLVVIRENDTSIIKHGDALPFDQREVKNKKIVFPVHFKAGEKVLFYLNIGSDGEIISLPIKLWELESWSNHNYKEQFFLGIYFGILLFVVIIYFFFYLMLKESVFLYFIAYIFFLGLFQFSFDGLAYQFFWPNSIWLGNHAILISVCSASFFLVLYARKYLDLKEKFKKIDIAFKVLAVLVAINFLMSIATEATYAISYPIVNILSLLVVLTILFSVIYMRVKGVNTNKFFVLAIVSFLVGAIVFILQNLNVIPRIIVTEHALKFGSALETVFLSLTMAGKYRDIQKAKENAQEEMLKQLNETNKIKEEINVKLEEQVKERTYKINLQNEKLQEKNTEILDSITYAKRIQSAILPSEKLIKRHLDQSFVHYKPKDIIAGDFYWLEKTKDKVLFAAADCTGHGVPGAMVSVVCNNGLNRSVREFGLTDPGKILDKTREIVIEEFEKSEDDVKDGMDIALCAIEGGKLKYAGANNPLWIIRNIDAEPIQINENDVSILKSKDLQLIEIKADKQPIGKFIEQTPFVTHEVKILKGDNIYIFSDGFADQFGGNKGKKYKKSTFKKFLLSIQHQTMEKQVLTLSKEFEDWKGDLEQLDDVCVIGVSL